MEQFSIGRVFSRAFALIRDTIPSVGLFILMLLAIEAVVGLLVQPLMIENLKGLIGDPAAAEGGMGPALAIFGSAWYWATILVSFAAMGMAWAGGVHGLLQHAWKGSATMPECFQAGFAGLLPVLGLIILWWLGVWLGSVFFLVPAAILASMWAVALPAQVGEGLGVFAALGRSRALTRGHRLSIFGVLVLLIVCYYVLMIALAGSMMGLGAMFGAGTMLDGAALDKLAQTSMWMILASVPLGWISGMLLKAIVVSLYLETVLVKEGGRTEGLTEVFG